MTLSIVVSIAQLVSIAVLFPIAVFKVWHKLEKRLDKIEYQLYENGGHTMKDQINTLVIDVAILKTKA